MKSSLKKIVPRSFIRLYHLTLAYLGALLYRFPSRKLFVIGVTGTKGKSSTVELVRAILEEAGYKTASVSTIQFCINGACERNLFKMTMPGRFFLSRFLRQAVDTGATHAVIEMSSEGAAQYRHKGIELDALIFTNLAPEHIESHGSFEAYAAAKLSLAQHLEHSPKRPRIIVANADDAYGQKFLSIAVEKRVPFSLRDAGSYKCADNGITFYWKDEHYHSPLIGEFNLKNILAVLSLGDAMGIAHDVMQQAVAKTARIPGRAEFVEKGQTFAVVVDYAHTPDSLRALYEAFKDKRIIGVLGNTGGGRDTWKRPEMGRITDEYCDEVILTNEDPYDEDPMQILEAMAAGMKREPRIILDRREAIRTALLLARPGDAVLISGKGTDPYIMGPNGSKMEWSDRRVAEEELSANSKKRAESTVR
jgi:UDP-N-acetylmuramoyl-L-alanyl-D-glutamate--2,6-diaminopimelate ligase